MGTFPFNFTIFDAKTDGSACYSSLVSLTTGSFGEWITEQSGVGASCNNSSKDYFLEIKINNETQGVRRRLTSWNFLRKDVNDLMMGDLRIGGSISGINSYSMLKINDGFEVSAKSDKNIFFNGTNRNMTKGTLRFYHKPLISNTRAITFDIHSNDQENTSGIVVEYSPDRGSFYVIRHLTETGQYTWDNNADLHIRDIFGRFVGSLTNRITKLFVQDIDFNGTISGVGSINITGNIRADGNFTVGGKIITNGGCLIPHANFWGERAGAITSGGAPAGLQYSFGDGNTDGGQTQPCSGKVVYMTINAQTANNGNGRIDIVVNNGLNSSCNVATPSTSRGTTQANCSLSFNTSDTLTPRTTVTPSGSNSGFVVSWWVVYD